MVVYFVFKLLNYDNDKKIYLWLNKDIEIYDFDVDLGWLGLKNMFIFLSIKSMFERNVIV